MADTDEQIVREALGIAVQQNQDKYYGVFAALDRLMARCLPELPDGFCFHSDYRMTICDTASGICRTETGNPIEAAKLAIKNVQTEIDRIGQQP